MINIETLLSSFDERGTLLKWLKAVEKALNEATLTSVDVITISSTEIKLKFIFEDDTTIETPTITLPKGDKGDTGEQGEQGEPGVGISNVTIDASNHLIVTLTDGNEIDAGEIDVTSGVVVDSAISSTSENPVQNKVIYNELNSKASQADLTALASRVGNVEGDIGTIEAQLTNKVNASDVYTKTEANNLLAGKQNALATTSVPDGTIDDAIGFDSQGNIVKGSAGGGGTQLYKHVIVIGNNESLNTTINIINESNTQFSLISDVLKYCGNISMAMAQSTFVSDSVPVVVTRYNLIITKDFVLYATTASDAPSNISIGDIDTNYFIPAGIYIVSDTVTAI